MDVDEVGLERDELALEELVDASVLVDPLEVGLQACRLLIRTTSTPS